MKETEKTTIKPMRSILPGFGGFQIENLGGHTLSVGFGYGHYCDNYQLAARETDSYRDDLGPTATMEVAVMNEDDKFVCLPDQVAAYVPVYRLGAIIEAVQDNDWDTVLQLCESAY
jgi:hypothetical protein